MSDTFYAANFPANGQAHYRAYPLDLASAGKNASPTRQRSSPARRGYAPRLARPSGSRRLREAMDLGPSYYNWSFDDFEASLPELIEDGAFAISSPRDRWQGQNWPLIRTVEDLGRVRFASRMLCAVSPMAQGATGGMVSYTIGKGYQHRANLVEAVRKVVLRTQTTTDDDKWARLVALVQAEVDEFKNRVVWEEYQQELFQREIEEGEFFLLFGESNRRLDLRIIEPEQIRPLPTWRENGSFGILTEWDDVLSRIAYGVFWQSSLDYAVVDAEDVIHYKRNVVRNIKRGVPDFAWNAGLLIRAAGKLLYNMGMGSSIQAAIAFIRSHEFGSKDEVEDMAHEHADYYRENVRTGQTEYRTRYEPGTVLDVGKGSEYVAPPYGAYGGSHVPVWSAVCQGVAAAKSLPEWMINGNVSGTNFASSVVAESPFVHRVEQWQGHMERLDKAVFRRVIETGIKYGRLPKETLQYVEVQSVAPTIVTRKPVEKAQCDQIYYELGIKSPQTIQQEENLDTDQEAANFRQWKQEHQAASGGQQPGQMGQDGQPMQGQQQAGQAGQDGQGGQADQPGQFGQQRQDDSALPRPGGAVGESPERSAESAEWDESKHPRDKGKFASKAGSKGEGKGKVKKAAKAKHVQPVDAEAAKKFLETGNASAFRIQDAFKPMPTKSADMWTDSDEYMPGTSGYANFSNALADMLLGRDESVTGENYSKNVRDAKGEPKIQVLAAPGKVVDGPGAEIVVPDAKVAWEFTAQEVETAFRDAVEEDLRSSEPEDGLDVSDARKLPLEDLLDKYGFDEDKLLEATERNLLAQAREKASKTSEDVSWDESKHPRDHGKFSSKPGGTGNADQPAPAKAKGDKGDRGEVGTGGGKPQAHLAHYASMPHMKAYNALTDIAALHARHGSHELASQYAAEANKRLAAHYAEAKPKQGKQGKEGKGQEPSHHPGSLHGSTVTVKPTKHRAWGANGNDPVPTKTTLTKQQTGRVGEAVVAAYLKSQGFADAKPMNSEVANFPIDLIEDHRPTEVKAGLCSNVESAQQWRMTFSKESPKEKEAYEQMTPEERKAWNAKKQARIHERKKKAIANLEKHYGQKVNPRTMTVVINPDTQVADIYSFDGFFDRIGWASKEAKAAYVGSVKYGH